LTLFFNLGLTWWHRGGHMQPCHLLWYLEEIWCTAWTFQLEFESTRR